MAIIRYTKEKSRATVERGGCITRCIILEEQEHGRVHMVSVVRENYAPSLECFIVRSYEEAVELQTKIINGILF